jgi:hypothetical protein
VILSRWSPLCNWRPIDCSANYRLVKNHAVITKVSAHAFAQLLLCYVIHRGFIFAILTSCLFYRNSDFFRDNQTVILPIKYNMIHGPDTQLWNSISVCMCALGFGSSICMFTLIWQVWRMLSFLGSKGKNIINRLPRQRPLSWLLI